MGASNAQPLDAKVARLAARQHGVVSRAQLLALGVTRRAIARRVEAGRLHRIHLGVYAVGHTRLTPRGRWMAAVLACGPGAVLSHRAAADLLGLRPSSVTTSDVTVPSRSGRKGPNGVTVHRTTRLAPGDTTVVDAIPVTTWARTLVDLADGLSLADLRAAAERAEVLRVYDHGTLEATAGANPGRRGAPRTAALLRRSAPEPPMTRSELERRMLALCRANGLPQPVVNARLGGIEPDFMWPDHRLIAETDGHVTHGTRTAFENDRARDARLTAAGWRVVRFTWRRLRDDPAFVAHTLRVLLAPAG